MISPWRGAAGALLLVLAAFAAGCAAMPTVHWSRRVQLNGRSFVFARLDSFQESSPEQKVSYKDGDFVVEGKGPITVNGFVIEVQDGHVLLAEQRVELSREDEVHFDRSMSWSFRRRNS